MQIQAGVLRPDSEVALEQLGYDQTDIERIQAEHRRANAGARMDSLIAAVKSPPAQEVVDVAATTGAVRAG
jgi:hypothetical protein